MDHCFYTVLLGLPEVEILGKCSLDFPQYCSFFGANTLCKISNINSLRQPIKADNRSQLNLRILVTWLLTNIEI